MTATANFDPIELEIAWGQLISIIDEAADALVRTSFSSIVREAKDYTIVLLDPQGRSAREVTELWDYISDRVEKNFRRTVFAAPNQAPGIGAAAAPRPVGGFGRRVVGQ